MINKPNIPDAVVETALRAYNARNLISWEKMVEHYSPDDLQDTRDSMRRAIAAVTGWESYLSSFENGERS